VIDDNERTKEELLIELDAMRKRINELEAIDSQRRQAEDQLKETEERLQSLFDLVPEAYYLSELDGTFIDGNRAAEQLIGYKKEELIRKSFLKLDLLSVKQIPKAAELLARNALGQTTGPDEFSLKCKDGRIITVEISTTPVKINKKTVVLGMVHDITERSRLEQELQDRAEQLKVISENVNEGLIHLDETGKIIAINKRAEDIFGYKSDEINGRNFTQLGVFRAVDLPKVAQLFGGVLKGADVQFVELEPRSKNGRTVTIEASTRVIKKGNKIEGILVIVRDITDQK
jgi:PAS domain S-box-containing protein